MPDLYDMRNNIEKCYEVATKAQRKIGEPPPDEVSFVLGFISCFGILTGRVDIGLDQNAPLDRIFDNIQRDLVDYGKKIAGNQEVRHGVREAINGFKRDT